MWRELRRMLHLQLPPIALKLEVSSLKSPILPPKAYVAVDHTGEALHTMAVLQTYQVDILKDLDQGED